MSFFPRKPSITSRCSLSWILWDASIPGSGAKGDLLCLFTCLLYFSFSQQSLMSSIRMKEERVMKIYYMYVWTKKGVVLLWDTEKELEQSLKKTITEEVALPEKICTEVTLSHTSTKVLLTDSEASLASKVWKADNPVQSPALEESQVQDAWTPYSGGSGQWLQCIACSRIFPIMGVLQKHVEHGVNEGVSFLAFHLTLTWLTSKKNRKGKRRRRKKKKIKMMTSSCKKETFWHENILMQANRLFSAPKRK